LQEIRRNLHFALLRGTCGLLRSCFCFLRQDLVKSVYEAHVGAGNQVAVSVDRHLDGAVSHLFFDVGQGFPLLNQKRREGMP